MADGRILPPMKRYNPADIVTFVNLTPERFEGAIDGHPFELDDETFKIKWRDETPGAVAEQKLSGLFERELLTYLGTQARVDHLYRYCSDFGQSMRGIALGRRDVGERIYFNEDTTHLVTFGTTGYGKFVSNIAPICLQHKGALVAVDPKGEAAIVTARARWEKHGQTPCIFDPFGLVREKLGGHLPPYAVEVTYNPLAELDPRDRYFFANSLVLANGLLVSESGKEPMWRNNAVDLLSGLIMHVCSKRHEANRDLIRVHEYISSTEEEWQALFEEMIASPVDAVRNCGRRMQGTTERTRSGFVSQCNSDLLFLGDPIVKAALSGDASTNFRFDDLLSNHLFPTIKDDDFAHYNSKLPYWTRREDFLELLTTAGSTLYVVVPFEYTKTHPGLLRLLINAFLTRAQEHQRFGPPSMLLVDEAAQLRDLNMLPTVYAAGRSNNVRVWTFWQNYEQLLTTYPQENGYILGNAIQILLGTTSVQTAEYWSKVAGKEIKFVRSSVSQTSTRNWSETLTEGTSASHTDGTASSTSTGSGGGSGGSSTNSGSAFSRNKSDTHGRSSSKSQTSGGSASDGYTDARVIEDRIPQDVIRSDIGPKTQQALVYVGNERLFWVSPLRYYEEPMKDDADPNPYYRR